MTCSRLDSVDDPHAANRSYIQPRVLLCGVPDANLDWLRKSSLGLDCVKVRAC
jgi:hypothetical protein